MSDSYPIHTVLDLAKALKAYREKAGMSQKEVAEKLGVHYQQIQRLERTGATRISTVHRLGALLGFTLELLPDEVLTGDHVVATDVVPTE